MIEYCFGSGRAAFWLAVKARELNPKLCLVDWHSFLRENRRNPVSNSAITRRAPRGNSHIYGQIRHISGGGRVRYSKAGLMAFLQTLKDKPGLVDRLVKQVED